MPYAFVVLCFNSTYTIIHKLHFFPPKHHENAKHLHTSVGLLLPGYWGLCPECVYPTSGSGCVLREILKAIWDSYKITRLERGGYSKWWAVKRAKDTKTRIQMTLLGMVIKQSNQNEVCVLSDTGNKILGRWIDISL